MHCCRVVIEHCNKWQKQPLLSELLREGVVSPDQHGVMCRQNLCLQDFHYDFDPVAGSSIISFFIIFYFKLSSLWSLCLALRPFDWWVSLLRGIMQAQLLHGVHISVWWDMVLGLVLSLCSGGGNIAQKDPTKFCIILVRINPIIPKVSCSWWVNM